MKNFFKIISFLVVLIILPLALPFSASAIDIDQCMVYDYFDKLSDDEEILLNQKISATAEKTDINFAVVITDDIEGKTEVAYADDFYDDMFGINTDGVLLLISYDEPRYVYMSTSGIAIDKIDGNDIDSIISEIKDDLTAGRVYTAINEFTNLVEEQMIYSWGSMIVIGAFIGIIVSLIVALLITKSYKLHSAISSSNYVSKETTRFTKQEDNFIKQYITTIKIESSSDSSGTHISSGGGSHGGGGSSF